MTKIVRKFASALSFREDRDRRRQDSRLFAGVVNTERANLENLGRSWRLRNFDRR